MKKRIKPMLIWALMIAGTLNHVYAQTTQSELENRATQFIEYIVLGKFKKAEDLFSESEKTREGWRKSFFDTYVTPIREGGGRTISFRVVGVSNNKNDYGNVLVALIKQSQDNAFYVKRVKVTAQKREKWYITWPS